MQAKNHLNHKMELPPAHHSALDILRWNMNTLDELANPIAFSAQWNRCNASTILVEWRIYKFR